MLTDQQIHDAFQQSSRDKTKERRMIARAIEAEVRKQDEALIEQMLAALETYQNFIDDAHIIDCQYHWIDGLQDVAKDARARLGEGGGV